MAITEVFFDMLGSPDGMPTNGQELEIKADWEGDKQENEINLTSLNFVLQDAKVLFKRKNSGLSGGVGIFEGVPYQIKIVSGGSSSIVFDGHVDLTRGAKFISCDEVEATLQANKSIDWLNEVADSFSFAYLSSNDGGNLIKDSDYVTIPYVLNFRPEAFAIITLLITIFISVKEMQQAIETVVKDTANFIESISIGFSIDIGDIISAGMKLLASIIYVIAIGFALTNLINELIKQLFPAVRRHKGIKVKTLFEKGCEHLNLTFSSSIFDSQKYKDLTIMPAKSEAGTKKGNGKGHPTANSSVYTFGDLIRVFKRIMNADIKIENGVLKFERWDKFNSTSGYVLPNVETNQSERLNEIKYNTEELISNYLIQLQFDVQDQNTLDNFKGTNYQIITNYQIATNSEMSNIKGLGQISVPFARAIRKDKLTTTEKLLKTLAKQIDTLIGFFGKSSGLASQITNRVGMMSLSADTTSVEKLLIINKNKIPASINNQLQAKDLWNDFHFINSFVPTLDPLDGILKHNQQEIYGEIEVPFCHEDYIKLVGNNRFKTLDGKSGEITTLNWSPYKSSAKISYKINELYTKNLKLAFNEGI